MLGELPQNLFFWDIHQGENFEINAWNTEKIL